MGVCAIVVAPEGTPLRTSDALERQTRQPDRVVFAGPGLPWEDASSGEETWLWFLDAGVAPQPEALERLLEFASGAGGLPAPALLAGKVVLPDGYLDARSLPTAKVRDPDLLVSALEQRVLSLRVARRGSLLVRRSAVGVPDGGSRRLDPMTDDLEWTARLLRDRPGLLVPGSVAVREPAAERSPVGRDLAKRGRLLLGDAIELRDKPWFAFRFLEEALAGRRYRHRPPWLPGAEKRPA